MNNDSKLWPKKFYYILIPCSIIIFLNSLEVMMKVKDVGVYKEWIKGIGELSINSSNMEYYELFLSWNLMNFFKRIFIPMILAIHSYFSFKNNRVNRFFILIWIALIFVNLILNIVQFDFDSVFYYFNLLCNGILIIILLSIRNL